MKDLEKVTWDQGRCLSPAQARSSASQKLMVWLMFLVSLTYMAYTLKLVSTSTSSSTCNHAPFIINHLSSTTSFPSSNGTEWPEAEYSSSSHNFRTGKGKRGQKTELRHLVFGIAASSKLWEHRKNYIKIWYKKEKMRGVVWLDDRVKTNPSEGLPPTKVSTDTSNFVYTNKLGHRSAIRISRIVTETLRMGHKDVRWFVMGDDDTVFVTDNLLRILNKYDHNYMYYIGSLSESHLQNIFFSYGMAYGGGGFAISYPLAKALSKMQDRCIQRYPALYGSDDRMQACMAELGVPLTKEIGFHQYDVYGNLFGLLAAHPVTPLVSLHHLDVVEPIFPNVTRVEAIKRLTIPMKLDSASLIQQSICHDRNRRWTISVSWGFAVQIFRGIFTQREMEMPSRTFLNWYRRADYTAYAFNTRPFSRNPCQKPFVFYFSKAKLNSTLQQTVTEYERDPIPPPECRWNMADPSALDKIEVHKKKDPHLWDRAPRRNCCRVMKSNKTGILKIEVAVCRDGEFSEPA